MLIVTRWVVYARITRGMMLSLREQTYVEAARVIGCGDRRIVLGHMLPNLLSPLMVLATLEIATMMLSDRRYLFACFRRPAAELAWSPPLPVQVPVPPVPGERGPQGAGAAQPTVIPKR